MLYWLHELHITNIGTVRKVLVQGSHMCTGTQQNQNCTSLNVCRIGKYMYRVFFLMFRSYTVLDLHFNHSSGNFPPFWLMCNMSHLGSTTRTSVVRQHLWWPFGNLHSDWNDITCILYLFCVPICPISAEPKSLPVSEKLAILIAENHVLAYKSISMIPPI